MNINQCVLCQTTGTKKLLSLVKLGVSILIQYAKDFKNTVLENHLVAIQNERETNIENASEVKSIDCVRKRCQTTCINNHEMKKLEHHHPKKKSHNTIFTWSFWLETNYMFCGKTCITDENHPERWKDVYRAEYKKYRDAVLTNVKRKMMIIFSI